MWTFLLLFFLGNACQIDGLDSTQMYRVKLKIELGAIPTLVDILKPFDINSSLTVNNFQRTTTCQHTPDSSFLCTCEQGHKWSDEVCKSHPDCCGEEKCNFLRQSNHTCISENSVSVKGSIKFKGPDYVACLNDKDSEEFQRCNDGLLKEMKTEYSTIQGFDSLTITHYRFGSVIADFEMIYAMKIKPEDLMERSQRLNVKVKSSCSLNTTGVVQIKMPPNPVHYNSQNKLVCSVQHSLDALVIWQLKRDGKEFNIITGRESTVKIETLETTVTLSTTSELWAGEYTCMYRQSSDSCVITHKASGVMDVCLKPNIYISINPSFSHCKDSSDVLNVEAECNTGNSSESYSVTWSGNSATVIKLGFNKDGVFRASTSVSCNAITPRPQMTCTLKNRCNQFTSASVVIHKIQEHDRFCEDEGDWQKTKADFTARLRCKEKHGIRQRKCSSEGEWEPEVSECVNNDLQDVLQQAGIVDIGLGSLDENTAHIFSSLEKFTNNTETINTVANVNTSVSVLHTLSLKVTKQQDAVVDDFLGSSSNLLEKSLKDSWEANADEDNSSLAERYLISVEQIIHMTKITKSYEKKNVAVASQNCSKEQHCVNKVFNTSVDLKGLNPGGVVTAGFKELENYLPNNYDGYKPNSFVISVTTEMNIADSVEVEINFGLFKPRPRNVDMICVAWDNVTKGWSDYKCKWRGSEGVCDCKHLSSFVILMRTFPFKVRFLTEITYVGLSVSVLSLTITLVIELIIWSAVVKTSTSYLRHTAQVNICLCLLVADCCFLASSEPENLDRVWCKTFVVLKHFCYLAMFFWMLWLSSTLLHQTLFLFHNVSKKDHLRLSVLVGYVCPLLIVTITFLANKAGAEGQYYSKETCWLVYTAPFKGSIHTFVIPVGIIAFFNMFAMMVVIMKLLDRPKTVLPAYHKEKKAIVTIIRTVVFLTPVFGVTWIFGFAVMLLDLTCGKIAYFASYVFTLLNAFQGLFILLTICLGDTVTREELLRRLKIKVPGPPNNSNDDSRSETVQKQIYKEHVKP